MTSVSDEQMEIESNRYSAAAFWVLPLESGRIAVLGPRRDLYKVVDTWDEAKVVGPEAEGTVRRIVIPTAAPVIDLGDLDL